MLLVTAPGMKEVIYYLNRAETQLFNCGCQSFKGTMLLCINWMLTASTIFCLMNCLYAQGCTNGDIRLRGGMNNTEGRIEVCYNATWGTVCDDMWGPVNADVACGQLGFSPAGAIAHFSAFFGPGTGPIWLDNVRCSGFETRLVNCHSNGVGAHNCHHLEDAGVTCQDCRNGDIRLRGGSSYTEGRVEVCYNATWGTVCDDKWDSSDADVTCRQLGLSPSGATAISFAFFGQGTGSIWLDSVTCTGNESRLYDCYNDGIDVHNCGHHEDAGVRCQPLCQNGVIRLRGGQNPREGRVEICYNNEWGTVCDDLWSNIDGNVACKQLGYSSTGAIAHPSAFFGRGTGPIWLDNVQCSGTETRLLNCSSNRVGIHNCFHSEDAGVRCELPCQIGDIRLRGGRNPREGRVEFCYNNEWGTVCDDSWSNIDGNVACRQLGFSSIGAIAHPSAFFGRGTGPIWLDNVQCSGTETRLLNCSSNRVGIHDCFHSEDAGVRCEHCRNGEIRLRGGSSYTEGRVEVCYNATWGTVCDDMWDSTDADVTCRQLGLSPSGATAFSFAFFGEGTGSIWLDSVTCTGNESRLYDCRNNGIGVHNCGHHEDAGVRCQFPCQNGDIRLRGGQNPREGRVEICYGNNWGTVCDDFWSSIDGNVVCNQIGFSPYGAIAHSAAFFSQGTGPIWLDNVQCSGTETKLMNCPHSGVRNHNCGHSEDAGVTCREYECNDTDIRLVDGGNSGRVEICFGGIWGTVCDDLWGDVDASVVCTQLGLPSEGAVALRTAMFGQGDGPIFLDSVTCLGNESNLAECRHQGIGSHDCTHSEDAGVVCPSPVRRCGNNTNTTSSITEQNYQLRLGGVCEAYQGGSKLCDGRVGEGVYIYFKSTRGASTQADLTFQLNSIISPVFTVASTICQELIQNVLCLYYYAPCGFNGTLTSPVSICPEECFYVQNECAGTWNQLAGLLSISGSNLGFINCSNPGQMLVPSPHCCVDAGVRVPVPTSASTMSSPVAATDISPSFLSQSLTTSASPPIVTAHNSSRSAPLAAGITAALLLLLTILAGVIVGLLGVRRRCRKKATNNTSWSRNQHALHGGVAVEETTGSAGLIFQNPYTHPVQDNQVGATRHRLTPVTSGQLRELTARMIIPSSRIRLLDTLGHGEFGIVYKAHLLPHVTSKSTPCPLPQTVAVKTLKGYFGHEEVKNMMDESVKMKRFDHPNVISLIGVCVDAGIAPYLIMPFMANGSLLSYLKQNRDDMMLPDTRDEDMVSDAEKKMLMMCMHIVNGMEYLAEQKFVHRDLAARNCMIDLHHVIKVSDFGLTEDVYAKNYFRLGSEGGAVKLPVKWMSPESLSDGVFTEKTDVWSYGITCWEIFSGGKSPYPGVDPLSLAQLLQNGQRLDKPLNAACSDTMYDIMLKCWKDDADDRPPFSKLVALVSAALERKAGYLDFSCGRTSSFLSTSVKEDGREKCIAPISTHSPATPQIIITEPDKELEAS